MTRWRACLHVRSPLATPLRAQGLFGHICWGIAWRDGQDAVAHFLDRMRGERPPLVLGEPTPVGFAPMPAALRKGLIEPEVAGRRQAMWESYRSSGLIPMAGLWAAAANLTAETIVESLNKAGWPRPILARREVRARGAVNRITGGSNGSGDRLGVEVWADEGEGQVEVPILSDMQADELGGLLKQGLENGYGQAASAGFGQVELASVEVVEDWPDVAEANAGVALGPCVPRQSDPTAGFWEIEVHRGKLGGGFALQAGAAGKPVEKRPVITLKAGAVFAGRTGPFVGRLVAGVHPERPEVVHYGMAPVLAVRLAEAM